jgi:hypothetical protein
MAVNVPIFTSHNYSKKMLWESLIQNFLLKSDKKSQKYQQNLIYAPKRGGGRGGGRRL